MPSALARPSEFSAPIPGVFPFFGMHMGQEYFENPNPNNPVFVHEMTHVWQGQYGVPLDYMLNSAMHQGWSLATTGATSQAYAFGGEADQKQWWEYNVEQ